MFLTTCLIVLRSEIPSGMCAKLHTVAVSKNRDHPMRSLYYCLFAPHIYGAVLQAHSVRGEPRIQRNVSEEVAAVGGSCLFNIYFYLFHCSSLLVCSTKSILILVALLVLTLLSIHQEHAFLNFDRPSHLLDQQPFFEYVST